MALRSPCETPLASSAGSILTHTPTQSSTLMGVAAQPSSRSLAMASKTSTTGGLSKTLKCKSLFRTSVCLSLCTRTSAPSPKKKSWRGQMYTGFFLVCFSSLTAVSFSPMPFQRRPFCGFPTKTCA